MVLTGSVDHGSDSPDLNQHLSRNFIFFRAVCPPERLPPKGVIFVTPNPFGLASEIMGFVPNDLSVGKGRKTLAPTTFTVSPK